MSENIPERVAAEGRRRVDEAEVVAPEPQATGHAVNEEELDEGVMGPGFLATKRQLKGLVAGGILGGALGAVLGFVIGLIAFQDQWGSVLIVVISLTLALATAGGVGGGFVWERRKQERGDPDV